MKKKDATVEEEIGATLNSLDAISRAEVSPYFYTRLIGRMETGKELSRPGAGQFFIRPAFSAVLLMLFIGLNLFMLNDSKRSEKKVRPAQSSLRQLADEYNMNVSTLYNENSR